MKIAIIVHFHLFKVEEADRRYILTQGPLPNTILHFWLMIWEQNSRAIIMLNKIVEKNQVSYIYFPSHFPLQ